jgi:hypothetical protein
VSFGTYAQCGGSSDDVTTGMLNSWRGQIGLEEIERQWYDSYDVGERLRCLSAQSGLGD